MNVLMTLFEELVKQINRVEIHYHIDFYFYKLKFYLSILNSFNNFKLR